MKNLNLLSVIACLVFSIQLNAQKAQLVNFTPTVTPVEITEEKIQWDKTVHDFGTIAQDVPAKVDFELTNNGNEPLVITKVKGSCGCTATSHDKEPVMPGTSTMVTATYNAKKLGAFTKLVKVTTNNSDEPIVLKIKGTVEK